MNRSGPSIVPWVFGILAVGWFVFAAVMLWRSHPRDRRARHESRVRQRISNLLAQVYEPRLTPKQRARREAQRRHFEALRAQAEAELAAEEASQRRT